MAAATLLAEPLREHHVTDKDLAAVQRRRVLTTVVTQTLQRLLHSVMDRAMTGTMPTPRNLLPILARFPQLSVVPAYLMGVGVRPEHAPKFARRAPQTTVRRAPHLTPSASRPQEFPTPSPNEKD